MPLTILGCSSSKTPSQPIAVEECKVVASQSVSRPDDTMLSYSGDYQQITDEQVKKGLTQGELVNIIVYNNRIADADRIKVNYLQDYIRKLQDSNIIGK